MRNLLIFVLLLMLAAAPVLAQDGDTIADIAATDENFSTLMSAVQNADPAVAELLSDPDAELTVFAPTNDAFDALAEQLGEEQFNALLEDTATLTAILRYHVTQGVVMSEDVVSALEANDNEFAVDSAQGIRFEVAQADDTITVDGAPLNTDMLDIEAENGVIHVIDGVMVPPLYTVAEAVSAYATGTNPQYESLEIYEDNDGQFTLLQAAVEAADPAVAGLLSDPSAQLTVFAPTDNAFEALGEDTLNAVLEDQAMLTNILQYHVTDGVLYGDEVRALVADGAVEVDMANGDTATVSDPFTIEGATIVMIDIETLNGVIHVIDAVMLPTEDENGEASEDADATSDDTNGMGE